MHQAGWIGGAGGDPAELTVDDLQVSFDSIHLDMSKCIMYYIFRYIQM